MTSSRFFQGRESGMPSGYSHPTAVSCHNCAYMSTILVPAEYFPIGWNEQDTEIVLEMLQRYYDSDHDCNEYR